MTPEWSDLVINGTVNQCNTVQEKLILIAEALAAWGNAAISSPPQNFGKFMAGVHRCLGTAEPEKLLLLADQLLSGAF